MNEPLAPDPIGRFRAVLGNRLGLAFEEVRLGHLAEVLNARVSSQGGDASAYLDRLEHEPSPEELSNIARQVTVGETYFFRHGQQFEALRSILSQRRAHGAPPPRLLSAGCSSGEEAYSLAMLLSELWPEREPQVLATDVNPAILERAREARYSQWSLRETPPASLARWFRQQGREFVVDDQIRRAVRFECRNLAIDQPDLLAPGSFEIIFCRNMLMYFTPENFRAAVARIARALVPEGYLFMGSAETLRGVSQDFHLCHTHGAFYYQTRGERERSQRPERRAPLPSAAGPTPPDPAAWVDQIGRAAARVMALTSEPRAAAPSPPSTRKPQSGNRPALDLSHALDLLHREQFAEALERVRALPEAQDDPEAVLLTAVLHASAGRFTDAEASCQRLLELDELNAGAHYVLALCNAGGGRIERAEYHDRVAVYLDPGFAMPRLHLGLMLRREGKREAACLELRHARSLLEREDGARLLMFGGGFNRPALLALCNAELEKSGGKG